MEYGSQIKEYLKTNAQKFEPLEQQQGINQSNDVQEQPKVTKKEKNPYNVECLDDLIRDGNHEAWLKTFLKSDE